MVHRCNPSKMTAGCKAFKLNNYVRLDFEKTCSQSLYFKRANETMISWSAGFAHD